jgi:hypothetical protein
MKGPRLCATISGLLMGSGLILSSLTQDPFLMVITFGIITGRVLEFPELLPCLRLLNGFLPIRKV